MLNIYFDCTTIYKKQSSMTGIQRVLVNIARNLKKISASIKLVVLFSDNDIREFLLEEGSCGNNINIKSGDIFISFGPNWDFPDHNKNLLFLKSRGIFLAFLFYDFIPHLLPFSYGPGFSSIYVLWASDALRICDLAFVYSESAKTDLVNFCTEKSISIPMLVNFRLGDEIIEDLTTSEINIDYIPDEPFILSVGTLEYRKNHIVLLNAYRYMINTEGYEPPMLIIVGKKGWLDADIEYQVKNDIQLDNKIQVLKEVSDYGLNSLYKDCLFTVYPSLYEGWGLPIAESLNHGKQCIASKTSSMVEIAPNLTRFAHPLLVKEWVTQIKILCENPEILRMESQRISQEYEPKTWESTASEIYRSIQKYT